MKYVNYENGLEYTRIFVLVKRLGQNLTLWLKLPVGFVLRKAKHVLQVHFLLRFSDPFCITMLPVLCFDG